MLLVAQKHNPTSTNPTKMCSANHKPIKTRQHPHPNTNLANQLGVTRRTLTNWFHDYWFVQVPRNTDRFRVYDQLFIDGTFFNTTCLLVAYTFDHVVAWRWCTKEDAYNYTRLFDQLQPPLIVTTDGQKGALKAITTTWPTTKIQRCLVHVKRNVQKHVALRPVLSSPKSTPGSLLETAESHHCGTSRRLAQTPPRVLPHLRGLA